MQGMGAYISDWLFFLSGGYYRFLFLVRIALKVLQKQGVVAIVFFLSSPGFSASLAICTEDVEVFQREFLEDFLALELTLLPGIDVLDCEQKDDKNTFYLRQTISKKQERLVVHMELYNPSKEKIWEKMDFVQHQSRQEMVARAKFFAQEVASRILENDLHPHTPVSIVKRPTEIPEQARYSHKNDPEDMPAGPFEHKNSLLLSVGLTTKTHFASKGLFEEHRDRVASKPYFIAGAGFNREIHKFSFLTSIFGALSSTELRRPLPSPETGPLHIKNLDILLSASWRIVDGTHLKAGVGLDIGYYFFKSAIMKEKRLHELSHYFSFREGMSAFLVEHFDLFASNLVLRASYFPFLQNSDATKSVFRNLGWQMSIGVESSLYRTFMLVLHVAHGGESFLSKTDEKRIVRYQNLAYMGLLARI